MTAARVSAPTEPESASTAGPAGAAAGGVKAAGGMWSLRWRGVSMRVHRRTAWVCAWCLAFAGVLLVVSLCTGAYAVAPAQVARALFFGTGDRLAVFFVTQERLPQALLALLVGCALGVSGAVFQNLSRNPLASPDVIGFNSGAATGAIAVLVVGGSSAQVAVGAIGGGLATAAVVFLLASRGGLNGVRLVLIGLGVTAMLGSVNSYLLTRSTLHNAQNAHIWLIGTLSGRSWGAVQVMAVALAVLLPVSVVMGRRLRMLEMGDDLARGLGVGVGRSRLVLTVLGVGLCAVAVANAGPVPFVALAAPQIAMLVARSPGVSLTAAGASGALLLSAAHLVSNQVLHLFARLQLADDTQQDSQLPVGVTTAVLGGVYLAWVLFRRRRTTV
ncbi:iron chelate uptake ABC transporter family permease subunit [Streptomyces physcomitrii]|uniref:FecCD family ABC transporter permease n=1 Tax=Streptomyces physcomitrii TaxID=2724184 RepID=UPI003411B4DF